jgi:hypothetical protein
VYDIFDVNRKETLLAFSENVVLKIISQTITTTTANDRYFVGGGGVRVRCKSWRNFVSWM